jgi:hypothetical protein
VNLEFRANLGYMVRPSQKKMKRKRKQKELSEAVRVLSCVGDQLAMFVKADLRICNSLVKMADFTRTLC